MSAENSTPQMVDVARVAELLGVPRSWVYTAAETGRIPSYRIGRYRRFRIAEIEGYIAAQREQAAA